VYNYPTILNNKDSIRKKFRKKRQSLSFQQIDAASIVVQDKLKELIITSKGCKRVFLYREFDNEVVVSHIIPFLLRRNIDVYFPVFVKSEWKPALIASDAKWAMDKNGLTYPVNPVTIYKNLNEARFKREDIIIVPGLAFSIKGERLGYGRGAYDRMLANHESLKVGVCYDFQVTRNLPQEQFDIAMDMIITEKSDFKFL
jgi:5-formyltetrahydrofolate cyclo-ligase